MNGDAAAAVKAPFVEAQTELEDAIHTLAQPLTALSFVLEMASLQNSPEVWKDALENARAECRRAFSAMEVVRGVMSRIAADGEA